MISSATVLIDTVVAASGPWQATGTLGVALSQLKFSAIHFLGSSQTELTLRLALILDESLAASYCPSKCQYSLLLILDFPMCLMECSKC